MGDDQRGDVTILLGEVRAGREGAHKELVRAIYGEIRRVAGGLMRRERPDHTLQPSALVNEALIGLLEGRSLADVPNRRYLFAAAAEAMRGSWSIMPGSAVGPARWQPCPRPAGPSPRQLR